MTQQARLAEEVQQAISQQAGKILAQVAGFIGVRTMDIGLRFGFFEEIAKHPQGISAEALAKQQELDPLFIEVWCRSAYAAEILELREDHTYQLAPYMDKLLLDQDFPGHIGGIPRLLVLPEHFDQFIKNLPSGKRSWYDQWSPESIQILSAATRPFYTRLIPGGISQILGLSDQLTEGVRVLELACGTGGGLIRMAQIYPKCTFVGVDGDAYSLELAADRLDRTGFQDRVTLECSTLEEIKTNEEFDVAFINVSMHECRNIEKVTLNVYRALRPGGFFIISDLPFPSSVEDYRTVPGRIMCGIQFVEALLDDQLLPTQAFVDVLVKHNFRNVKDFEITPVHVVIYGQK